MDYVQPKTSWDILTSIGAKLTAERERQGLTLKSVSQRLRILEDHLSYIETGKLDNLPAMTYVIGYVRSYARLLGLDDATLCAELKASLTSAEDKPEYNFIESNFDKKTGAGRVALAALVAGVLMYGGWYSFSVVSTPQTTKDVADAVTLEAEEEDVAQTQDNAESIEPELVVVAPRVDPDAQQTDDSDIQSQAVVETLTQEQTAESDVVTLSPSDDADASTETIAENDVATNVTNAYAVNRSPDAEIIIEAIANSWVEVTRADGTSVTSRLMRLGDTYLIPSNEDLFLTTGNAGGLNIRMGSEDPFTLGAWGEALRELPLDKAIIAERY